MAAEASFPVSSSSPAHAGAHYWLSRAGWGFLCGAALAVLEFLYYFPHVSPSNELGLTSIAALLIAYGGEGVLLALAVALAERRARPRELRARELALAVIAGTIFGVTLWHAFARFVLRDQLGVRLFIDHVGQPQVWTGVVLYQGWLMLFFGGLAAAVYASRLWHGRMIEALRSAEISRATSEAVLAQARLDSLRARVDPELVFRNIARLEDLYGTDPAAAERLLDELVTSLRTAVADIRVEATEGPAATLA
jgi:hypothetical protein